MRIQRALLSVSDKSGIVELARALAAAGVELLSSGGTAARLREAGVDVTDVSDVTGWAEMLGGRVKTLHPRIHAAILARRDLEADVASLRRYDIPPIDLVVCNLYRFEEAVAAGADETAAIEHIDIGGPALIRAAAKNFNSVAVVVRPSRYRELAEAVGRPGGVPLEQRRLLALEAFSHTAAYDAAVARYLAEPGLPSHLTVSAGKLQDLRYGENPHQRAALYGGASGGVAAAEQLHGKDLSYNNLLDADAAWGLVGEFDRPAAVIVKHSNPCGAATNSHLHDAYRNAQACDPRSAYGGVVALNRPCDPDTARALGEIFIEVVLAPDYDLAALEALRRKKALRVLRPAPAGSELDMRTISGGFLVQSPDPRASIEPWRVVTSAQPTEAQWEDLRLAWTVVKHVKSNAIVLANGGATVGIGAGQMSRVDAAALATGKAGGRARGAASASDAFFPFADGVEALAEAGVEAVAQPGGSMRDDEVVAAANRHGIAMAFTGRRHFLH